MTTKAWQRYEQGRAYNARLVPSQYDLVNTNVEFFAGNQWLHLPQTNAMAKLPKPTFNIIKRVASLFVASLTSSAASISFDDLEGADGESAASVATAEVQNLLEKFKMDYRIREALFDGAQTGDYCAHFYWNADAIPYGGAFGPYRGEIEMELVDGINVMFGDPNCANVEKQPYILIAGRESVESLEAERAAHAAKSTAVNQIGADGDAFDRIGIGGVTEPEGDGSGKALYAYMYEKKNGTVHVSKATKNCVIYEDIDTGLSRYPIAWGNWEKQKNQYHGRALVTGIIPNQIFINTMFAMAMRHLQLMGFPKTVYNADLISQWSNEVGQAIGVRGLMPGQDIAQVAYNLQPADMSEQILRVIDKAVSYTKDCLGATDAQLGNVKPDNTSALMVLQSSAQVPLENIRAGLYEWLEDIGAILLDMIGTYYGVRAVVRYETAPDGAGQTRRRICKYDFSKFKNLWFNVRVNAGATTYYSEIAMVQTLDNLRRDGTLEVIDYLERIPDKLIPRKAELIGAMRERAQQSGAREKAKTDGGQNPLIGGKLSEDKALAVLPVSMQAKYSSLPTLAQKTLREMGGA